jgi:hypothetical protein
MLKCDVVHSVPMMMRMDRKWPSAASSLVSLLVVHLVISRVATKPMQER